ncbi:hypothetical protein [Bacteroides muris (ex Afrizal et al. 2022)]|uniref:hypothetical protein n=1 Tax=Bacteroides muris (ex Afrizal et al. 2022) TaxID=2516960 RepID=UPI001FF0C5A7|nr:hypothetical protein [Bacteroides muris (ex Afrizal et al. 2022)]
MNIYMYICDVYESSLKFYTNQELLTVQRYFSINEIHTFTKAYLLSWFPNLPNYRLNLMSEAINELVKLLLTFFKPIDCDSMTSLIDSMPITTCAGKTKQRKWLLKMIILSSAQENNLTVLKREADDGLINRDIFADKYTQTSHF